MCIDLFTEMTVKVHVCPTCGKEYQMEPDCWCAEEAYDAYLVDWAKKQEDKVYALYEEKELLAAEYKTCVYTDEEYAAAIKAVDIKGAAINHDLAAMGFDPIY